jgi:UDP-glucose 4-epimerase
VLSSLLSAAVGYGKPLRHGPPKAGEQRRSVIDPALAKQLFGWAPQVSLEAGVKETARWFGEHRARK